MKAAVLLLTYNQQAFVCDAVNSILMQDCEPLNILVSDDASEDRTFEVVRSVVNEYRGPHSVRVSRNARNKGIVKHINSCMELIEGDVIIAAGGDDVSLPHRASRLLSAFRGTNTMLVHSRVHP